MKKKLSLVVSVFNGEDVLEGCLESAKFADEIVVINNSSTDKTLEIAQKYTTKILTRPNNPMLNINKNFGFAKAKGDWILCLDADERVSEDLKEEIKEQIQNSEVNGYFIPRKNVIFGKWIEHTGWYPDHQLRLFRNGKGKFEEKHVHEMVKVTGRVEYLKNNLVHYNYTTVSQFLQKIQLYAPNEADNLIEGGYKFTWQDALRFPLKEFLSRFFAREGYKDGFHGLMLSLLMAFYHLVVFVNIWEKRNFEKIEKNLTKEVETELKKSYKELTFWIDSRRFKEIENPFKKMVYRIFRKIREA